MARRIWLGDTEGESLAARNSLMRYLTFSHMFEMRKKEISNERIARDMRIAFYILICTFRGIYK